MRSVNRSFVLAGGLVVLALSAQPLLHGQGQGQSQGQGRGQGRQGRGAPPPPPKNLQVLPKDWTGEQVVGFMRGTVAAGLGVQCTYCHVQDRSVDEKPEKLKARKMLKMMMDINHNFPEGVGDPAVTDKVTCYTCHRGATKPLRAPEGGGGL